MTTRVVGDRILHTAAGVKGLRVLHVIPSVAPRYGGPSTAISSMCDALNRTVGVTAEIATTDADGPDRFDRSRWKTSSPLHIFPVDGSEKTKRSSALRDWLNANTTEYDLVHTHSVWNDPVYAACSAARRFGKPLVYRPCGMLSPYSWGRNRAVKRVYWWWRERQNLAGAAAVHCTSEAEANEVRAYRVVRGEVRVIPLGVDSSAWTASVDRNELRSRCGPLAAGVPIVLFLSRLHPKKGITDQLLPAIKLMKTPAFLAIAGGTDDSAPSYPEKIRHAIAELGLSTRVSLIGPVKAADRWRVYDGADVFALPSHQENFGLVVAEAMARGLPVAVSDQVQLADDVLASGGRVTARDPREFATALDSLLGLSDRGGLEIRTRDYARRHFDWDITAGKLVDLYRSILSERRL